MLASARIAMSLLRFCKVIEREEDCEPPNSKRSKVDKADHNLDSDAESDIDEPRAESTSHDSSILTSTAGES